MRKTKLALLLLAALLVGVCIGFYGYGAVIQARIQRFSRIPDNLPQHITGKLTERLGLDADQQEKVLAVFLSYEGRMKETREQSQALLQALMEEMRSEVQRHLTPAQIEEHNKILQELDQRHRDNRALMRAFPAPAGKTNAPSAPGK